MGRDESELCYSIYVSPAAIIEFFKVYAVYLSILMDFMQFQYFTIFLNIIVLILLLLIKQRCCFAVDIFPEGRHQSAQII